MQQRLYRTTGIVLLVLTCLAIQGCGTNDTTTAPASTRTYTIQASVGPKLDGAYAFIPGDYTDGIVWDEFLPAIVDTDTIQLAITHVYIPSEEQQASSANYTIKSFAVQETVDDEPVRFSEFKTRARYATDIGVLILVDNSGSFRDQLDQSRRFARQLAKELLADKQAAQNMAIAIMPMAMDASQPISTTFTNNRLEVDRQTRNVNLQKYTPLYATIGNAIALFDRYEQTVLTRTDLEEPEFKFEEKFIVVISDGQDNSSGTEQRDRIESALCANGIKVFVLAVQGSDAIREDALLGLTDCGLSDDSAATSDHYFDLSTLSPEAAQTQVTEVKDAIIASCLDRYNLYYHRSANIPSDGIEATFVITAELKTPPTSEAGGALRNLP
jgi:Mg-chelatase subunit ChlD